MLCTFEIRGIRSIWNLISVRNKSNHVHYYKRKNKVLPTELALRHYDNFYGKIYGPRWQSIRLALLSPKKYAAIINNFVDFDSVAVEFRKLGAANLRDVYHRNLIKITRRLQQKQKQNSVANCNQDNQTIVELSSDCESETENLAASLLSDSTGQADEFLDNQATFNLDLTEFVPVTEMKYSEQVNQEQNYYLFYDPSTAGDDMAAAVNFHHQTSLTIPPLLNLYTFPRGDFTTFPAAQIAPTNLFNYYLMDAASALPALAMDIQDGDYVADLCAAPGGKALIMFMMMKNDCRWFLNDISASRYDRLRSVFDSFVPRQHRNSQITFNHQDGCLLKKSAMFDKILVDVPCTNDRHSLYVDENNIFGGKRQQERFNLPYRQLDLLLNAMEMVRSGGTIVYATCSLSPIQNDGVVHMALRQNPDKFTVVKMAEALRPLEGWFHLDHQLSKYGTLIVPHICSNFGPIYFSKLVKNGPSNY